MKKNDITITAIPGIAGLKPTIDSIKFSKKLFIANKESIICGWKFISRELRKYNTKLAIISSGDKERTFNKIHFVSCEKAAYLLDRRCYIQCSNTIIDLIRK